MKEAQPSHKSRRECTTRPMVNERRRADVLLEVGCCFLESLKEQAFVAAEAVEGVKVASRRNVRVLGGRVEERKGGGGRGRKGEEGTVE